MLLLIATLGIGLASFMGATPADVLHGTQHLLQDPKGTLAAVVDSIDSMGPLAPLYFGVFYTVCEVAAIPSTPLTMSAGYLFGLQQGTLLVLLSAGIAAAFSYLVGQTVLRSAVEDIIADNPKFQKIDKAIGKEGFRLMLLLRLSPIFPFSLSNYLYGASSIDFWSYFCGTLLGFAPGTFAYVYTGMVGQELTLGNGAGQPLYVYAGGLVVLAGILKLIADVATRIVEDLGVDEAEA